MVNRCNYLWAKGYLAYLADVSQLDAKSSGRYWFYLKHLLLWADEVLLCLAASVRPSFPSYLAGASLAPATLAKIIQTTRRFLRWLKLSYPREFHPLPPSWIEALRPPRVEAGPSGDHQFVTLDEVLQLTAVAIPQNDLALRRDRAAAAMLYLSGMRAGAFVSLPLEAVDLNSRTIKQWPSLGVRTKNHKHATTYLLEIPELLAVVEEWDTFVRAGLPLSAAWYAPVVSRWGEQTLSADVPGENRNVAIGKRMRKLFTLAGLAYRSPHRFRHGHAVYALQRARTMADYKAISMNLMHEDIRVTDGIYAPLVSDEVRRRIAELNGRGATPPAPDRGLAWHGHDISDAELSQALMIAAERLAQ